MVFKIRTTSNKLLCIIHWILLVIPWSLKDSVGNWKDNAGKRKDDVGFWKDIVVKMKDDVKICQDVVGNFLNVIWISNDDVRIITGDE